MNNNIQFVPTTSWLKIDEARAKRDALIADGTFKKGEVKLSSYRWVNPKDHSQGYMARVMIIKGVKPELEVISTTRKSKITETTTESGNTGIGSVQYSSETDWTETA